MIDIITPQSFTSNFPKFIDREIIRDNVVQLILQKFDAGDVIIFVTGPEESGKTSLLSQFAKKNSDNSISIFINPINKFSSSLENIIIDIVSQIKWITEKKEIIDNGNELFDFKWLAFYLHKLHKYSKGKITYYFILDGFEHIAENEIYLFEELFQQLPFGYNTFKFLVSDNKRFVQSKFLETFINKGKLKYSDNHVLPFGLIEIMSYCKELLISKEQAQEILKITEGIPGRIKSISEKLREGIEFNELFEKIDNYTAFLDYQWRNIDMGNPQSTEILSLLTIEESEYDLLSISQILNITIEALLSIIDRWSFITINDKELVQFKSHYFKKYLRKKLIHKQNQIDEAIITFHLKNKNNIDSIIELPKRYEKNKNFDALLKVLNEDHFLQIIEKKESFTFIEDQTSLGITAARTLKKNNDFYRLCLQKSCIAEIKQTYIWEAEIEAKIELKDFETARQLAELSLIKEDKLRLLIFLARKKKEKGLIVESDLMESIKSLYSQINPTSFYDSEEILDIASNLLYTFPELAIDFLEKANGNQSEASVDLSFAKLALLFRRLGSQSEDESGQINNISAKIKDPHIKNLTNAFISFNKETDVNGFLTQIQKITSTSDKLQILRIYTTDNPKNENIEKVIELALDILITSSEDNPVTASVLEELSIPLPYISYKKSSSLIPKFESFKSISKERGPTVSQYKFLTNLACAEIKGNFENSRIRFTEIFLDVSDIKDLGIQSECLAYIYTNINQFDKEKNLESADSIETTILHNINKNLNIILDTCAHQYQLTKNIFFHLSKSIPQKVIEYSNKLNTQIRRDKSLLHGLNSHLTNDFENLDFPCIDLFYKSIVKAKTKSIACLMILTKFKEYPSDPLLFFKDLIYYINIVDDLYSNFHKCEGYCRALEIINKSDLKTKLLEEKRDSVIKFWNSLDDKYEKIEFGFKFSIAFLPIDKSTSKMFHDTTEREKQTLAFDSPIALTLYYNVLVLGISSLSGLIKSNLCDEKDIERIVEYIHYHPNQVSQIKLISALLEDIHESKQIHLFEKFFNKYLNKFITFLTSSQNNFSSKENYEFRFNLSIVTFLHNRSLFYHLITSLNNSERDSCYNSICDYLFKKEYDSSESTRNENLKIDFETALSTIEILDKMSTDERIVSVIESLKTCAKNNSFTKENITFLKQKLTQIIETKLPDLQNIKHDGYKLLARAYVLKLSKNNEESEWNKLIDAIKLIPNISDTGYVLSIIANLLPTTLKLNTKFNLLSLALSKLGSIQSYTERVDRYSDVKQNLNDVNTIECRGILTNAIKESVAENSFELFDSQKSIIDFAYGIDKHFADELIKIIDNDPARKPLTIRLKKHLKGLKLEKEFVDDKNALEVKVVRDFAKICSSFSMKLRNDRVAPKKVESTIYWLDFAQKRPISESFSIFGAFIVNLNKKYEAIPQQTKFNLQPFFESTIKNIQLVKILAIKNKNKMIFSKQNKQEPASSHLIIKPGERELALEFIRKWVQAEVVDYLKISDPFFKSEDLELVKEVFLLKPEIKFYVLAQYENAEYGNLANLYRSKWKQICDQEPPETTIVIVGHRNGSSGTIISPNHDRWYLTYQGGLRVGTSFNSIGSNKNSEISILSSQEAIEIEETIVNKYLSKTEKYLNEHKLNYIEFDL